VYTDKNVVFPLSKALESGYSNIRYAVEMTYLELHFLQYGDSKLKKYGYTVRGISSTFSAGNLFGEPQPRPSPILPPLC
jgi:hypothetical protein